MTDYQVFWGKYDNFVKSEFDCKETSENKMRPEFINILQQIRDMYAKPMIVTSGYRSPRHSVEFEKDRPGVHTFGVAADFKVFGESALQLVDCALACGVRRIGVSQAGEHMNRFIHLDIADQIFNGFPEGIWSY